MGSGKHEVVESQTMQLGTVQLERLIASAEEILELIGTSGSPSQIRMRVLLERRLEWLRAELRQVRKTNRGLRVSSRRRRCRRIELDAEKHDRPGGH